MVKVGDRDVGIGGMFLVLALIGIILMIVGTLLEVWHLGQFAENIADGIGDALTGDGEEWYIGKRVVDGLPKFITSIEVITWSIIHCIP